MPGYVQTCSLPRIFMTCCVHLQTAMLFLQLLRQLNTNVALLHNHARYRPSFIDEFSFPMYEGVTAEGYLFLVSVFLCPNSGRT
jgi:hypothetical protein